MDTPRRIATAFASLFALQCFGMGIAAGQDWSRAKVVKYRVDGVHKARDSVVKGDYGAKGDVTDRITVEFTWDMKGRKLVGPVTVTDGKSEVANLKSDGTNCPPPQLKGDYEHFQSASNVMMGDLLQINGSRIYPAASVSNYPASCSMRAIPGDKEAAVMWVPTSANLEMLSMPGVTAGPVTVAKDGKSFSMKAQDNWVFTFTPTLVQ
jgi:hypothetical protein